jgi:predicted Fe-Mo cluster-binding NifX family protein
VNEIKRIKIGIPSQTYAGLEDVVAEVFGKSKTFTIADVEEGRIKNVKVIENPGAAYEYGSGPIAVKTLIDQHVNIVISGELGIGAKGLLDQHNIKHICIEPNTLIKEVLVKTLLNRKNPA